VKYLHFQSTTIFLDTDSTGGYHMQSYDETSHNYYRYGIHLSKSYFYFYTFIGLITIIMGCGGIEFF